MNEETHQKGPWGVTTWTIVAFLGVFAVFQTLIQAKDPLVLEEQQLTHKNAEDLQVQ